MLYSNNLYHIIAAVFKGGSMFTNNGPVRELEVGERRHGVNRRHNRQLRQLRPGLQQGEAPRRVCCRFQPANPMIPVHARS
jgi:hypothetical protein